MAGHYAGHASFTLVDTAAHTVLSASEARGDARERRRFEHARRAGLWIGGGRVAADLRFGGRARERLARLRGGPAIGGHRRRARRALTRHLVVGLLALVLLAAAAWVSTGASPGRCAPSPAPSSGLVGTRAAFGWRRPGAQNWSRSRASSTRCSTSGHDAQLVHQATHDPLTGLPNRTLLYERVDQALHGDRHEGSTAVLFIGLDRLHIVNDGFGRDAADRVLGELATRLSAALRRGDTLARFGGEEFVVLAKWPTAKTPPMSPNACNAASTSPSGARRMTSCYTPPSASPSRTSARQPRTGSFAKPTPPCARP